MSRHSQKMTGNRLSPDIQSASALIRQKDSFSQVYPLYVILLPQPGRTKPSSLLTHWHHAWHQSVLCSLRLDTIFFEKKKLKGKKLSAFNYSMKIVEWYYHFAPLKMLLMRRWRAATATQWVFFVCVRYHAKYIIWVTTLIFAMIQQSHFDDQILLQTRKWRLGEAK